jgi:hypothetical protein
MRAAGVDVDDIGLDDLLASELVGLLVISHLQGAREYPGMPGQKVFDVIAIHRPAAPNPKAG